MIRPWELEVRLVRSVQFPPSLIVSANFAVKPLELKRLARLTGPDELTDTCYWTGYYW